MINTKILTKKDPFALYKTVLKDGLHGYAAGLPSYPANFSRDTLIAGILSSNSDLLASQLAISARHQGRTQNSLTGEQPGKIHHEIPGAALPNRIGLTTYNACDSTALFLIGAEALYYADSSLFDLFIMHNKQKVELAVQYVLDHTNANDNLFWERPPEGADTYTLRVTYWKDSILPHENGKTEPIYPVTYALSHFIAARSLLSAAKLLDSSPLYVKAESMFESGIATFIKPDHFIVYIDAQDTLSQASSDELHCLAYIPKKYAKHIPLKSVSERAEQLQTPFGYMCTPPTIATTLLDKYHGDKIWVFEQALINYGAEKFGLESQSHIAKSIIPYINEGQELYGIVNNNVQPEGNPQQLWSIAAREYFEGNSNLQTDAWL